MRPSLDTKKWRQKLQSSSYQHPSTCGWVYTTTSMQPVQTLCMRDRDAIISRWSPLFGACWVRKRAKKAKLTATCWCSRVTGELSDIRTTVLLAAIIDSHHFWAVRDYGNTSRSRSATAAYSVVWSSRFLSLVGFSGPVEPSLRLGFYVWPFGLLNHIETS